MRIEWQRPSWRLVIAMTVFCSITGFALARAITKPVLCDARSCPVLSNHAAIRAEIINFNLQQTWGDKVYAVLGDSIVEGAILEPVCGLTPINAGIGGATVQTLLAHSGNWEDKRAFDAVIIAVGINDAQRGGTTERMVFLRNMKDIVRRFVGKTKMIAIASIMPVEQGKSLGASYFDNTVISQLNEEIRILVGEFDLHFIDMHAAFLSPEGNSMRAGGSVDGVHLSAASYSIWKKKVREAIVGVLKCSP